MIIDRYARPANLSEPIVSDPILQELDWILDDPYLFALTRTMVTQGRQVAEALENSTDPQAQRLAQQFAEFLPLVEQAIEQTVRRVRALPSPPAVFASSLSGFAAQITNPPTMD
jgi:hypothetical protein